MTQDSNPSETDLVTSSDLARSRAMRDVTLVVFGGQIERLFGILTALGLRWGLGLEALGIYTGLKIFLDNTNRSSLGVGSGAVQKIPVLRAAGREGEARYIANVAYTTNTITCSIYAFFLAGLAVWKMQAESHGIWTRDWVWGLLIVAGLALLKRQESFIVAILRAHQEYSLTARADVLESVLMAIGMFIGIRLNGLNGVLQSIGLVLFAKILFLRSSNPLRFQWAWDLSATWKLMRTGLPILANAIVFGAIIGLDRGVILVFFAEGERSVGLYSVAVLGTSWCMDLAGRVVLVLYTHFQTTYGISSSPRQVAEQAVQASEFQASLLAPLSGAAYIVGPVLLGWLFPRFQEGVPAFRPLMLGILALSVVSPARQMMIAVGRTTSLLKVTSLGLGFTALAVITGGKLAGLVGISSGMTVGGLVVLLLVEAAAYLPLLGFSALAKHLLRLAAFIAWPAAGTLFILSFSQPPMSEPFESLARVFLLFLWSAPAVLFLAMQNGLLPEKYLRSWVAAR